MEANYLSMGRWIHCLACHKNVDREEFIAHVDTHPGAIYGLKMKKEEEILEAITEPGLLKGTVMGGKVYYPRHLSLEKLAEYLATHYQ